AKSVEVFFGQWRINGHVPSFHERATLNAFSQRFYSMNNVVPATEKGSHIAVLDPENHSTLSAGFESSAPIIRVLMKLPQPS
ncbi:MAG: hypothetical protein WBW53_20755, partial [Terriglobales bacterium]